MDDWAIKLCKRFTGPAYWDDICPDPWVDNDVLRGLERQCAVNDSLSNVVAAAIDIVGVERLWIGLATLDDAFCRLIGQGLLAGKIHVPERAHRTTKVIKSVLGDLDDVAKSIEELHDRLRGHGYGRVFCQEEEVLTSCPLCTSNMDGLTCSSHECDFEYEISNQPQEECPLCAATRNIVQTKEAVLRGEDDARDLNERLRKTKKFYGKNAGNVRSRCWGWLDEHLRTAGWDYLRIEILIEQANKDFKNAPCPDFTSSKGEAPLARLADLRYKRKKYLREHSKRQVDQRKREGES